MKSTVLAGFVGAACVACTASAAAPPAPQALAEESLPYPQDKPIPLPNVSAAERERNKQVVLDFYHKVADAGDFSMDNFLKYFDPNFIQHDPAEPSTAKAYATFFGGGRPKATSGNKLPPEGPMRMPGTIPTDSNHSPVETLIADGDLVVAVRRRNWDWPGGPEPVYNGIFVDIWRLKNGKIMEQWCTATPADAQLEHIKKAQAAGNWVK